MLKFIVSALFFSLLSGANAQSDPRSILGALIGAFQTCGPSQVYQLLSPQLFNLIAQQTGGRGCYQGIAQAGPINSMQIVGSQIFPIGPLYVVRVQHANITADWFIGFNQITQRVEFLNFQAAQTGSQPPQPADPHPPRPTGGPSPSPPAGTSDGCQKYPAMCAR